MTQSRNNFSIALFSLMFCLSLFLSFTTFADTDDGLLFRISGSNTIGAKLGPAIAEGYLHKIGATDIKRVSVQHEEMNIVGNLNGRDVVIEIKAHGSTTGFKDMQDGKCDLAMASRRIKDKEQKSLLNAGFGDLKQIQNEHILALDGIAVIVNQNLSVEELTIDEIARVFSGEIQDWQELGGNPGKIVVYARDDKSGTFDTFKSLVLGKSYKLISDAKRFDSNADLSDNVARDVNGIGFVGLPYIRNAKALAVADGESPPIYPTTFTVRTEDYALSRRLHLYSSETIKNRHVNDFVDYALSEEGQKFVKDIGFIDLNIRMVQPQLKTAQLPAEYLELTKKAKRLSVNFRFGTNGSTLDNKAQRDLDTISQFIQQHLADTQVFLVGFTDSIGNYHYNIELSRKRAQAISKLLSQRKVKIGKVIGLGPNAPVGSNKSEDGRSKNRRVEIWVM